MSLFASDTETEKLAEHYFQLIIRKRQAEEKHKVGSLYDLTVDHKGGVVTGITLKKNAKGEQSLGSYGEYVLRTNRKDLSDEEISKIHRSLTRIESSFKSMKSELGLRPNFHKADKMTTAHIAITAIGYHFLAPILKKLRISDINHCWGTAREVLSNHIRLTTPFNTKND